MSRIKVGDLTVVVRWPCCGSRLGAVGKVKQVRPPSPNGGKCRACGAEHKNYGSVADMEARGTERPVAWLKRIPPLDELESEKNKEELTA